MFFKNKKEIKESPLHYYEEKSYMSAILLKDEKDILKESIKRISSIKGVKVIDNHYSLEDNVIYVNLSYEKEEYEIGLFYENYKVPEFYLNRGFLLTEKERKDALSAEKALVIFMKFGKNPKKSYHLQLKLILAASLNSIAVLDESAEIVLPIKWATMTANSKVLPSTENLFSVQIIHSKNKKVWLHTHGLNRCGITELEILDSDKENFRNHYNLIKHYAMYLLDSKEKKDVTYKGSYIGRLTNNLPIVATCISWTIGIKKFKRLKLGNLEDRKNSHNSKTSIIFLYTSEDEEKNKELQKINIYDKLWGDNPIYFISNEETERMKKLAQERFDYVKNASENNTILVKIGLPLIDKGKFEHIWFEIKEINGNKFKAILTQEPYEAENIHKSDEKVFTKKDVTDWIIYTDKMAITPETAYLLEK